MTLIVYCWALLWVFIGPILILRQRRINRMFADEIATLTTDVEALIAQNGPAAVAAAVAAKDASDAAAVAALDVTVKAALTPAAPPAA